jgi:secondary thiamine-phosphate synthase enzyme
MAFAFEVATSKAQELVDISRKVRSAVRESGVPDGVCYVYVPHTTAAIAINENTDPDVREDILAALDRAVPRAAPYYKHAEGNAHAHIKATLVGASQAIPVQAGHLALGTWQTIFLCEFDGPRTRKVVVSVIPA